MSDNPESSGDHFSKGPDETWAVVSDVPERQGVTGLPVIDDREPLGRGREILAGVALVILVLCFTPTPIDVVRTP